MGIDALKHKAQLLNYPGDYQKQEPEMQPAMLSSILQENKRRFLLPLTPALQSKIELEYRCSLDVVLPLKSLLEQTDTLIDRIVYRLYGLTDEEIQVVDQGGVDAR